MSESKRRFRASDLQVSDLIVVETPTEAWLVLEADLSASKSHRKVRVLSVDFVFPLHYQLLRRNKKTVKLEEIEP